mmetsp:Transcript_32326/g.49429  ORF Transcript_32326/g.49429 Transcript_32326/m.49429 type:complete len:206 (+) Transcript_32326:451-1068(+)
MVQHNIRNTVTTKRPKRKQTECSGRKHRNVLKHQIIEELCGRSESKWPTIFCEAQLGHSIAIRRCEQQNIGFHKITIFQTHALCFETLYFRLEHAFLVHCLNVPSLFFAHETKHEFFGIHWKASVVTPNTSVAPEYPPHETYRNARKQQRQHVEKPNPNPAERYVWGKDKFQLCKKKSISVYPIELIVSITLKDQNNIQRSLSPA